MFEQRKIAAREELENADETTASIREAKSRIDDKMKRLMELGEFVRRKDADAYEKLAQAEEISRRLEEMESSVRHDFEDSERERQEITENRLSLAQERVRLLKERARDRKGHGLPTEFALLDGSISKGMTPTSNSSLRRALASIKDDLNKMRQE